MPIIHDTAPYCRRLLVLVATGFGVALPAAPVAAADAGLKRAERIDMRRLGSVSEDERSVLRIESRVGMSGVDEARSVLDMMNRLRQMEAGVVSVGNALRSLPVEKPPPPLPTATEFPAPTDGIDWKLMAANLTALVLVAIWWRSKRKSTRAEQAVLARVTTEARQPAAASPAMPAPAPEAGAPAPVAPATALPRDIQERIEPSTAWTDGSAVNSPESQKEPQTVAEAATPQVPDAAAQPAEMPSPAPDAAPADAATGPAIDFVLEEVDPNAPPPPQLTRKTAAPRPTAAKEEPKPNLEPTLHLAEIMLSMGLEEGAAKALVEYTEANPRDAVYHMLKLLGIYRKRGLHKEFQDTAEKLRQHFNIQAEDWNQPTGEAPTLEKFTRISQHVESIWGRPDECISYLKHLLEDNREGARAGFPKSVAEEILLLVEILKELSDPDQPAE